MKTKISTRKNGSRRVQISTGSKSRVEPQHRDACDINTIMRKMHAQGVLPHFKTGGNFGNFTSYDDFHTMRNRICDAKEDFMRLPAELRDRFNNDPGELVQFLEDPDNREECQEMGLIAPPGHLIEPTHTSPQERAEGPSEAAQEASSPKSKNGLQAKTNT